MKHKFFYILLLLGFVEQALSNPAGTFLKSSDGIIVYPDQNLSGNAAVIKLQIINNKIIRVSAWPTPQLPNVKSLITVLNKPSNSTWTTEKSADKVLLKTSDVTASVNLLTGAVSFFNKAGQPVLSERKSNGKKILPVVYEGQQSYTISQTFETTADDAYYGLGQHQSDQFNYKGQQVFL